MNIPMSVFLYVKCMFVCIYKLIFINYSYMCYKITCKS